MLKAVVSFPRAWSRESCDFCIANENREYLKLDKSIYYDSLPELVDAYCNAKDRLWVHEYFKKGLCEALIAFETEEELKDELAEYLI